MKDNKPMKDTVDAVMESIIKKKGTPTLRVKERGNSTVYIPMIDPVFRVLQNGD